MKPPFPDLQTLLEPDAPAQIRGRLDANFRREETSVPRTISEIVRVSNGGIVVGEAGVCVYDIYSDPTEWEAGIVALKPGDYRVESFRDPDDESETGLFYTLVFRKEETTVQWLETSARWEWVEHNLTLALPETAQRYAERWLADEAETLKKKSERNPANLLPGDPADLIAVAIDDPQAEMEPWIEAGFLVNDPVRSEILVLSSSGSYTRFEGRNEAQELVALLFVWEMADEENFFTENQ